MSVETKYKKHELRDHIYEIPDTYVGSVNLTEIKTYVFDDDAKQMIDKDIKNVKHMKTIKISVDKETGTISIMNDGDGIDIDKHSAYNNVWIPELILGELLTSTNYNQEDEK